MRNVLRNLETIKILREEIFALRKSGNQCRADQLEKFLACDITPEGYMLEISRAEGEGYTTNYPFHHQNIIIAAPEEVPSLCNKKGLIIKGSPIKLWERDSLSWRDIPAGEGSSKQQ